MGGGFMSLLLLKILSKTNHPSTEILPDKFLYEEITYVRLVAIAVGIANLGGLAKLSIRGNNLCCGVTDVGLKAIARGCPTLRETHHGMCLLLVMEAYLRLLMIVIC
ncbi:hypothetical protein KY289_008142 [Solanum tuberosum]|nr:hypothetical protein KY289_008142 [Solanum tuberosum]